MGRLIRALKSEFTSGELDPLLDVRTQITHYATGASVLKNVFPLPQGGLKRRPGLEMIKDVTTTNSGNSASDGVAFIDFEFSTDTTYGLLFLDQEFHVLKDGEVVHTQTSGVPWTGAQLAKISWTQSADTLIIFHEDVQPYKILRVSDTSWTISAITFDYIPKYDYSPSTTNPAADITPEDTQGQIKITASASIFSASDVDQKIAGNGGQARIVQFNSATEVIASVEINFFNNDLIANGDWELLSGFEDAWSNSRGWPATGTFHEGRLFVGGGPRPSTVWGSRVAQFFDFKPGTGLDNEPVEVTMDTDKLNTIFNMKSNRDLQIFTNGGEFYEPGNPITPNNFAPRRQTGRGSKEGVPVIELDGATLFVQRGGKAVREFVFDDASQAYNSDNLSLLSSHLINDPVAFAKRRSISTDEADILLIVNADGTMSICSTLRSQQVVAWAQVTSPNCEFISCGVDNADMYAVTKRTIDGSTKYFIEFFNEDHLLDSSVRKTTGLPSDAVSAAHLPNTTVDVIADDSVMADIDLDGSGNGTMERDAETYSEIGLDFEVRVETMPIEFDVENGTSIGIKKRVVEVTAAMIETGSLVINVNNKVVFRQFGLSGSGSPLDAPPPKFTGRKTIAGILGYDEVKKIIITQDQPAPMTLLGVSAKVSL